MLPGLAFVRDKSSLIMGRDPKLSASQKRKLTELEPALREAVNRGDYAAVEGLVKHLQRLLRPSGHETRLMQAKLWLWEAAMEAGDLSTAESGFIGVRGRTNHSTRLYLEATALLAICLLRAGRVSDAKPLIKETLARFRNIRSPTRQSEFKRRIVERFAEESVLGALSARGSDQMEPGKLQEEAGGVVQRLDTSEIYRTLGQMIPSDAIAILEEVRTHSIKQLTATEQALLPSPESLRSDLTHGKTVFGALRRVVWRALCDPTSEVYAVWWTNGMKPLLDKKLLGAAIAAALAGAKIGIFGIGVYFTALVLRLGIDTFCEISKPRSVMAARRDGTP